jgi:hypothetical protein
MTFRSSGYTMAEASTGFPALPRASPRRLAALDDGLLAIELRQSREPSSASVALFAWNANCW